MIRVRFGVLISVDSGVPVSTKGTSLVEVMVGEGVSV